MQYDKKKIIVLFIALFAFSAAFAMEDATNIGRYLSVNNKPLSHQRDLLSQTIQIRFPHAVQTIGDAINYLLRYSGYALVDVSHQSPDLKNTLKKPLPLVDRSLGPMALREALITLIGPAFSLSEDVLNREVDFHLKSSFSKKAHNEVRV